jgi:predicted membrane chloride channel (bestrophin family)
MGMKVGTLPAVWEGRELWGALLAAVVSLLLLVALIVALIGPWV